MANQPNIVLAAFWETSQDKKFEVTKVDVTGTTKVDQYIENIVKAIPNNLLNIIINGTSDYILEFNLGKKIATQSIPKVQQLVEEFFKEETNIFKSNKKVWLLKPNNTYVPSTPIVTSNIFNIYANTSNQMCLSVAFTPSDPKYATLCNFIELTKEVMDNGKINQGGPITKMGKFYGSQLDLYTEWFITFTKFVSEVFIKELDQFAKDNSDEIKQANTDKILDPYIVFINKYFDQYEKIGVSLNFESNVKAGTGKVIFTLSDSSRTNLSETLLNEISDILTKNGEFTKITNKYVKFIYTNYFAVNGSNFNYVIEVGKPEVAIWITVIKTIFKKDDNYLNALVNSTGGRGIKGLVNPSFSWQVGDPMNENVEDLKPFMIFLDEIKGMFYTVRTFQSFLLDKKFKRI